MRGGADGPMKAVYVPPRPFPAPVWEPSATGYWVGPLLLALTIGWLLAACWVVFHRRRERLLPSADGGGIAGRREAASGVELAIGRVRCWVVERLGRRVESLTREEWAESVLIREEFGGEATEALLHFMSEAESARWSGCEVEREGWNEKAERVIAGLEQGAARQERLRGC